MSGQFQSGLPIFEIRKLQDERQEGEIQIMGLFGKFKKEKTAVDWSNAYAATPKFYAKPDGSPFGAIALTEGTETILPKMPQNEYAVDGKRVPDWKIVLVSTTKDCVMGDCDYQKALKKLEKHTLDSRENTILVKGLSLDELEAIVG